MENVQLILLNKLVLIKIVVTKIIMELCFLTFLMCYYLTIFFDEYHSNFYSTPYTMCQDYNCKRINCFHVHQCMYRISMRFYDCNQWLYIVPDSPYHIYYQHDYVDRLVELCQGCFSSKLLASSFVCCPTCPPLSSHSI